MKQVRCLSVRFFSSLLKDFSCLKFHESILPAIYFITMEQTIENIFFYI